MDYFPLFLDIRDQAVLVVGGGNVAERKVCLLRKAGARVRVAAPALNGELARLAASGGIEWAAPAYGPELLEGVRLAIAATDDRELNHAVYTDAERRGVPVNVVDDQAHCRFITPAIVDRSPLLVAISSGGASPVLARRIRAWIERLLPAGIGRVARAAGRARPDTMALPQAWRRRLWDGLLNRANVLRWSLLPVEVIEAELRAASMTGLGRTPAGRVILVGAGPGRADLLTIRAQQALGQADVILHDRLVPAEVLDMARRDAELIDVGKRAGRHHATQRRIHDLLVAHARAGKVVVRLKGGDPFVFGRGGEELQELRAQGIDYEVVPGVTAATGCAAYAGIPLTHREHAHALTLITGHTPPGGEEPAWLELAGPGRTLAVYMGVKQADALRQRLLDAGLPGSLPAALVADGTRDSQRVVSGNVGELPAMAAGSPGGAPGLFIIGEVARLGSDLAWFEGAGRPVSERAA